MTLRGSTPEELRQAFDRSFAEPPASPPPPTVQLLVVNTGGGVVALRLDRLRGVHVNRRIVPLPGAPLALLGVAGVRGSVLPVWDLAHLLGAPPSSRHCRWIAECDGDERVALGFESLVRQIEAPETSLRSGEGLEGPLKSLLPYESHTIGVVDIRWLLESLPSRRLVSHAVPDASTRSGDVAPSRGR